MQVEIAAEERLRLTPPPPFGVGWSVNVLEGILSCLRKNGRCLVEVDGGANDYVPTVAEMLF